MRQLYAALLFLLIVFLSSCLKSNEPDAQPGQDARPVIKGTRKVNLIVDKAYDLSKTQAHSIADSISMSGDGKGLAVPESFESAAFFIDNVSGEILAVVRTDTVNENILVNAESVAEALLTLVPAYHSLSIEQREKFNSEASTTTAFKGFVSIVDDLLKSKRPIYSTDDAYIAQLLELNNYLLKNYLGDPNLEGGRVQKTVSDDDFTNWLTRDNGASLGNQVHSYVYAEFAPVDGGSPVTTILDPQPLTEEPTKQPLAQFGLKDNCYKVTLNQSHNSVKSKNILEFTTKLTGLFLNIIFNQIGGNSKNDCIGSIAGVIVTDVSTTVMGAANQSLKDILKKAGETAVNAIITGHTGGACVNYAENAKVITKALAGQLNVFSKFITIATTAYSVTELVPYLLAITDPVELTEVMQLYEGKLKEACVQVAKDGTLSVQYGPGAVIYPSLKLVPQSIYADWVKSGFKVKWIAEPGNGRVNLTESSTTGEGKATVAWTMPSDRSGEVTLKAELRDKEGDQLAGSPMYFKTQVNACPEEKILGKWHLQSYYRDPSNPKGYSPQEYHWNIILYEGGRMTIGSSSESTVHSRSYSFYSCRFSYDYFGCGHSFIFQEGVSTYTVSGCGGFSHHVYTKM